ncbi:MAG: hypothetical protein IJ776_08465 [Paludibacteraceae bacterium]|nr:hypothetical protein [Paludibacteraceae bacterium]
MDEGQSNIISELKSSLQALPDILLPMSKEQMVNEVAKPIVEFEEGLLGVPYVLSQFKKLDGEQRLKLKNLIERTYYQLPENTDWDAVLPPRQQFDMMHTAVESIPQLLETIENRLPDNEHITAEKVIEWTPSQTELFGMLSDISFGGIKLLSAVYNEPLREPFVQAMCRQGRRKMGALWTADLEVKAVRLVVAELENIKCSCEMMSAFATNLHLPLPEPFNRLLTEMTEAKTAPQGTVTPQSLRELLQVPECYRRLIERKRLTDAEAIDKLMDSIAKDIVSHEKQKSSRLKGIMQALEQEKWIGWSELGRDMQYRLLRQAFREQLNTGFTKDTFRKDGAREMQIAKEFREQLRTMFADD